MINQIKKSLENYTGIWQEKNCVWEFVSQVAERKVFLSTKKLTYSARIKIDEDKKTVLFSEMLAERGFGLTFGGDFDDNISGGFGLKKYTYKTSKGYREGTIEEKSALFGKIYQYKFDFGEIKSIIKKIVEKKDYKFVYQISPVR